MLLAWIWRFRPGLWHRDNVLVLIGLLVVGATLALKITAGRPTLPYFLPTAAIAILLAILLDASIATIVIAIVAIIGGAVNGGSLEFAAYIFLGGMAGIVAVRKGDRLQVFVQASLAVLRRRTPSSSRSSRYSARATFAASSSCGSRRRPRRPARAWPRSGRSRSSARCSGS